MGLRVPVGNEMELESHLLEPPDDIVPLHLEVGLQAHHLLPHLRRLQHAHSSFLERHVTASVQVATARPNGLDELLGAQDPGHSPARQAESLSQPVDDENIVVINVLDVFGGRNHGAVAFGGVVVAAVELVHDEGGTVTADVLNLAQFRIRDHLACGVARVGGEDDRSTAGDFLSDLVGVHVVLVVTRQRNGDSCDLKEIVE